MGTDRGSGGDILPDKLEAIHEGEEEADMEGEIHMGLVEDFGILIRYPGAALKRYTH